jgi:hypothetical protein
MNEAFWFPPAPDFSAQFRELAPQDGFSPDSNFLAQFRKQFTDEELDEAAADFERALIAFLKEAENEAE